jgi:hypothetical protein
MSCRCSTSFDDQRDPARIELRYVRSCGQIILDGQFDPAAKERRKPVHGMRGEVAINYFSRADGTKLVPQGQKSMLD